MAITRQAILIGAPSVKPELPGVMVDIRDIKNFLMSNQGGAWREDEIIILVDQPLSIVRRQLACASSKDYVFITCSGHGEHRIGQRTEETVMWLNEREAISINEVNPQNKRHLVVADVCRKLKVMPKASTEKLSIFSESRALSNVINYREIFNNAVMSNPEGRIVLYSCNKNQIAGDDGTGGVFTQELLSSPSSFGMGIVDINQAFGVAKVKTYQRNAPQDAVMDAGRRRDFLPFAINN